MAGIIVASSTIPFLSGSFTVYNTTPQPAPTMLSEGQFEPSGAIVEKILQELPPVFVDIAKAESHLVPTAYNPEWHYKNGVAVCQGSYGIMQIACVNYEGDPTDLYDIELNIQLAKKVYESQGIKAWGVCRTINCNG